MATINNFAFAGDDDRIDLTVFFDICFELLVLLCVHFREQIAHRLIGNFGFTAVGRSFDALEYVRNTKRTNLTLVAGRPTEGVFQLRGMKELDVDIWYGAFTGALKSKRTSGEYRLLALHYHDGRGALKTDNRPAPIRRADAQNIRVTTLGGNYLTAIKTGQGTVDLLAWGVGQFGSWGNQDHRAGAFSVEGGWQPEMKWRPWARLGYTRGSGDGEIAAEQERPHALEVRVDAQRHQLHLEPELVEFGGEALAHHRTGRHPKRPVT